MAFRNRVIKNKIFNTAIKYRRSQTLGKNTNKNKKGLLYTIYSSGESKKDFTSIDEKHPGDIFLDEDIYDLNKNENDTELVKNVKNQIFRNRIFHDMRKNYNFYNDNRSRLVKIPNINLAAAQNKFLEKTQKNWINKIYFLHREELIKKHKKKFYIK